MTLDRAGGARGEFGLWRPAPRRPRAPPAPAPARPSSAPGGLPVATTPNFGAGGSSASWARIAMRSTMPRGAERPAGDPVDEVAQGLSERRPVADRRDRFEIVAAAFARPPRRRRSPGAFRAARRRRRQVRAASQQARDSCRPCRPRRGRGRRRRSSGPPSCGALQKAKGRRERRRPSHSPSASAHRLLCVPSQ